MSEQAYSGLRSWILAYTIVAIVGTLTLYFGLFRLVFRIPLLKLIYPCSLHAAATILIAPVFYVARRKQAASSGADVGLYFWGIGAYCLFVLFCWTFFGLRDGVIPHQHQTTFYLVSAFVSIGGAIAGYYSNKMAFPRQRHTNVGH